MPHPPPNPPMTYAPAYYGPNDRIHSPFSDAAIRSPIAKPHPAARGTIPRHSYANSSYQTQPHPFVSSYNSLPEAPESLSGSSTASYSHPDSTREYNATSKHPPEHDSQRASPASFMYSAQAERGAIDDRLAQRFAERSEKHPRSPTGASSSPRQSSRPVEATVFTYTREDENMPEPKDHVAWVLVCLSFITPFYSIFAALYTGLCLLLLFFLTPLRLIRSNSSLRNQTSRLLSPLLNLHLQMICSHDSIADNNRPSGAYDVPMLLVVHLLSPFVSVGVAFAAWIAASFWVFAAIMGNPDGTERKDDGKAAVLGVRKWWEQWLARAIK